MPFKSIINPDPSAKAFLVSGIPNSLNISSKGDPGGNWNGNGFLLVVTVWVVEILTTEGISFSAKSAKEDGTSFALLNMEKFMNMKVAAINFRTLDTLSFHVPNY